MRKILDEITRRSNQARQATAGRRTASLHIMKNMSIPIHTRSRERWLILFSLDELIVQPCLRI